MTWAAAAGARPARARPERPIWRLRWRRPLPIYARVPALVTPAGRRTTSKSAAAPPPSTPPFATEPRRAVAAAAAALPAGRRRTLRTPPRRATPPCLASCSRDAWRGRRRGCASTASEAAAAASDCATPLDGAPAAWQWRRAAGGRRPRRRAWPRRSPRRFAATASAAGSRPGTRTSHRPCARTPRRRRAQTSRLACGGRGRGQTWPRRRGRRRPGPQTPSASPRGTRPAAGPSGAARAATASRP
mmetsp:Transcript_43840/g.142254  ORF Transcript_43840/g.142254 Transcript_43840/m.142254 type:complete len:245 (+) Transcript_43840:41-775(+)